MLFILKVLLVVVHFGSFGFSEKHMWARILRILTGISWIMCMIIPEIFSEIPGKPYLWGNICLVIMTCGSYFSALVLNKEFNGKNSAVLLGIMICTIIGCIFTFVYFIEITDRNVKTESIKTETNTVRSVTLVSTSASSELSGNLQVTAKSNGIFLIGSNEVSANGTLTTEQKINYWYYASDGSIKPGSVPKESIKIFFIEDDETPHMDILVTTRITIKKDYNTIEPETKTSRAEIGRTYVFYVPEGSILNSFNFG